MIAALLLLVFMLPSRWWIAGLYIDSATLDADQVIRCAAQTLIVLVCMQPFQINSFALAGCLRGAGDNLFVAIVATVCVSLIRPAMACLSVYVLHFDLSVTWIFAMSEMAIRCVLFYTRFSAGKWKKIQI